MGYAFENKQEDGLSTFDLAGALKSSRVDAYVNNTRVKPSQRSTTSSGNVIERKSSAAGTDYGKHELSDI